MVRFLLYILGFYPLAPAPSIERFSSFLHDTNHLEVSFATKFFVQKELDILGSRNATAEDFRAVISYLERGIFPLDKMITRKVRPEEAAEAVKTWSENPGKVMKILLDFS